MDRQKVIAIVGPTASGKSALAVELAKRFGGEIISADSRQVYLGLDIGTGKITKRQMHGVPHHLLDVAPPKKRFPAHDFVVHASKEMHEISARGNVPIICGGTGFYIDALLGRIELSNVPADERLRAKLDKKSAGQLFALLRKKDPKRAKNIDKRNKRRLIRALEISMSSIKSPPSSRPRLDIEKADCEVLWLGIAPKREELRERINKRLAARLKGGMIAEARALHAAGLSYKRMEELGLEYRSLARFLRKKITREALESELQAAIWHYARRQLTYWRRNKEIRRLEPAKRSEAFKTAGRWLERDAV